MSKSRKSLRYGKRQPRQPVGISITIPSRRAGKTARTAAQLEAFIREKLSAVMMLSCPPVQARDLRRMAELEELRTRTLLGMDPATPGGDWSPDPEQAILSKLARHTAPDRLPRAVDFIKVMRPWDEAALLAARKPGTPHSLNHAMKDEPQNPRQLPEIDPGTPERGHVVACICVFIFAAAIIGGILWLASL